MSPSKKTLEKLQKIKNHMESAKQIGNTEEAEVFAKKMQEMMMQYELSMSDLEFKKEVEEPIGTERITWEDTVIGRKKRRCDWIERLCMAVAEAYACRIMVTRSSNRITLVGHNTNRELCSYVCQVLVESAHRMSQKEYEAYWYEVWKEDGHADRAKGYRASWLDSFVSRILQRVQEIRRNPQGEECTALVRVDMKAKAVSVHLAKISSGTADALQGNRGWNSAGHQHGKDAADRVSLKANGINTSSRSAGQLR